MGWRDIVGDYQRRQERWRDPIHTALLVPLSLDVFVIMPLAHFGLVECYLWPIVEPEGMSSRGPQPAGLTRSSRCWGRMFFHTGKNPR
jgi:hypothetical protein